MIVIHGEPSKTVVGVYDNDLSEVERKYLQKKYNLTLLEVNELGKIISDGRSNGDQSCDTTFKIISFLQKIRN